MGGNHMWWNNYIATDYVDYNLNHRNEAPRVLSFKQTINYGGFDAQRGWCDGRDAPDLIWLKVTHNWGTCLTGLPLFPETVLNVKSQASFTDFQGKKLEYIVKRLYSTREYISTMTNVVLHNSTFITNRQWVRLKINMANMSLYAEIRW